MNKSSCIDVRKGFKTFMRITPIIFHFHLMVFFFGQQRGAQLTIWASDQIGNFTNNFFLLRYKIRMIIKMKTTEN